MTMLHVSDSTAVQVTALIMAGGTLIAYIIGEGLTDAANIEMKENVNEQKSN